MISLFALAMVVGVLDNGLPKENDPDVTVVEASPLTTTYNHGGWTLKALREGAGDPHIKVVYAVPFERDPEATRPNEVIINYQVAFQAMIKMKKAGVTHVCTSFSTHDAKGAADLKYVADQLGLTLVASLGNDKVSGYYPAMLPGIVAVLGKEQENKVGKEARARADYVLSGVVEPGVQGSSFAAARQCGKLVAAANARVAAR